MAATITSHEMASARSSEKSLVRQWHSKVRTGCRTCKLRRIKCDETFPACRRCVKSKRICDGYGVWGGGNQEAPAPISARKYSTDGPTEKTPTSTALLRMGVSSAPRPRISAEEQIYLDWFVYGTAVHSPRLCASPFWGAEILQVTMHEPMVLQVLLALSSAHKRNVLDPANRARYGLPPDVQELFLLKHYGLALRNMQKYIASETKRTRSNLSMAVIMCTMFVLLEYMRGNYESGYVHLASGAELAKQLYNEPDKTSMDGKTISLVVRLHVQTEAFLGQPLAALKTKPPPSTLSNSVRSPVCKFESLAMARHFLENFEDMFTQSFRRIPVAAIMSRKLLEQEYVYLHASLRDWVSASERSMADAGPLKPEDFKTWNELRLRCDAAIIKVNEALNEMRLERESICVEDDAKDLSSWNEWRIACRDDFVTRMEM